jgi:hypothetical protein
LRWIWLYRRGNLFDWDEAGYLSIAAAGARTHEFTDWVETVLGNKDCPATPGITAAIFSLFGIHPVLGFLVPLTAAALTLFLIFSMGFRVGGPGMAWIALLLVATMPVFVNYSRLLRSTTDSFHRRSCYLSTTGNRHPRIRLTGSDRQPRSRFGSHTSTADPARRRPNCKLGGEIRKLSSSTHGFPAG